MERQHECLSWFLTFDTLCETKNDDDDDIDRRKLLNVLSINSTVFALAMMTFLGWRKRNRDKTRSETTTTNTGECGWESLASLRQPEHFLHRWWWRRWWYIHRKELCIFPFTTLKVSVPRRSTMKSTVASVGRWSDSLYSIALKELFSDDIRTELLLSCMWKNLNLKHEMFSQLHMKEQEKAAAQHKNEKFIFSSSPPRCRVDK